MLYINMRAAAISLALVCLTITVFAQNPPGESTTSFLSSQTIPKGETSEEVVCILCSAEIQGRLTGDLILVGGNADISGTVDGDVVVVGGWIRTRGSIGGDAVVLGGEVERQSGGRIGGEVESFPWLHLPGQRSFHPLGVLCLAGAVLLLVLLAGVIWRRETSDRLADRVTHRWWLALPLGVAVWYLYAEYLDEYETTSTALEILFWILLGLLFIGTWFGSYGIAWAVGRPFSRAAAWKTRLAGGLILMVALLLPALGLAVFLLIFTMGLGAGLLFTWPALRSVAEPPTARATEPNRA